MIRRVGPHLLVVVMALGATVAGVAGTAVGAQDEALRIFISVDMEGIGGIGTGKMTSGAGKDYARGRELMTAEVNTVVEAIFAHGPAEVLVNDSHGDMQNLLHTELDERVEYIQGNIKPLGMVQGLDSSFDAAIFLGYHARAGTPDGFLAHTGSGSVKGLWLNGTEVGEGGLNAHFAAAQGVPVIVAAGDRTFTEQFSALVNTRTVATKESHRILGRQAPAPGGGARRSTRSDAGGARRSSRRHDLIGVGAGRVAHAVGDDHTRRYPAGDSRHEPG